MSSPQHRIENGRLTKQDVYFPETVSILGQLLLEPSADITCSHGGEPAMAICEVPEGCVALDGLQAQALCEQHIDTDGSFKGMRLIVDLSTNADWSRVTQSQPDFCIMGDGTGEVKLMPFQKK